MYFATQQNLDEARALLRWLDTNSDGRVTYEEFHELGALLAVGVSQGDTLSTRVAAARTSALVEQ